MASKRIDQLDARTPIVSDVLPTSPNSNGPAGKSTVLQVVSAGLPSQTGNSGKYLATSNGALIWTVPAGGGTVISVGGTGSVNGITLTGTVTDAGNLTLGGNLSNVDLGSQITGTLSVINGGTGANSLKGYVSSNGTNPFTASLTIPNTDIAGLGTISTQNANSVNITGGSISGITDLAVADGGTGASTASGARLNLNAAILGTNNDITSLTAITGGISSPNFVQLDTGAAETSAVGKLFWDNNQGTAAIGLLGGNVVSRLGQNLVARVTNAESTTIGKGQAVYLYSAQGDRASVKLAYNTSDATSAKTLGIAAENITAGGTGFVMCQGVAEGLNLGSYNTGDTLYLGNTAGSLTNIKPSAPNHLVYLGVVERANNGNGLLYVRTQNGYELDEIHDVAISSPAAGQTIIYDKSNSLWKNASLTAGTGMVITNADASITITNNGVTTFNAGTTGFSPSVATNGAVTLSGVLNVTNGGTGANSASNARTNLGLGTISVQDSNNISITGGNITGIVDLAIADGGTGASNANDARTNLGLGNAALLNAGVANGVATLDSGGSIPTTQLPAAILGSVKYQGTWNASSNSPALASGVGSQGFYYVVSADGSTNLDGITTWKIGDWAIFNGTAWQKVDNTDAVTSVNGYTGSVSLNYADVGAPSTNGANATGSWGISITGNAANVTGVVSIVNGGTGKTTATDAINALLPDQSASNGKFLTTNGANVSWVDNPLGTVTQVQGTGTVNGITLTGNVTSSGNLTLGGTLSGIDLTTQVTGILPVTNGGTGANTLTGYLKGSGTSAVTASSTIPGSDISGDITGNAANVTGTVLVSKGGTGTATGSITGTTGLTFTAGPNTGGDGKGISLVVSAGASGYSRGQASIDGIYIGKGISYNSSSNILIGPNGYSNTSGSANTLIGGGSTGSSFATSYNTMIGFHAGVFQQGGSNTIVGAYANEYNIYGSKVVSIGADSANYHADGTTQLQTSVNSVYIGYDCRGYNNSDSNSIVIGYQAIGKGANTTVIGNTSTTSSYVYGTTLNLGNGASSATVTTNGALTVLAGGTNQDVTLTPSGTGKVNAPAIKETVFAITDGSSVDINPSNGGIQTWTLGANRTPTASSFAEGQSVTLMIDDGTAYAITWSTISPTWVGGSAPTLATTGYTVIELWKRSSTIYGALVGTA